MSNKTKKMKLQDKANELMENYIKEIIHVGIDLLGENPPAIDVVQYSIKISCIMLHNLTGSMIIPMMYRTDINKEDIKIQFSGIIDAICENVKKTTCESIEDHFKNKSIH